jgi:hypothetical protein
MVMDGIHAYQLRVRLKSRKRRNPLNINKTSDACKRTNVFFEDTRQAFDVFTVVFPNDLLASIDGCLYIDDQDDQSHDS